jgi:hypothetical protein
MKGFGEFCRNPIGFSQKSCFSTQKQIFAKKIANKPFSTLILFKVSVSGELEFV